MHFGEDTMKVIRSKLKIIFFILTPASIWRAWPWLIRRQYWKVPGAVKSGSGWIGRNGEASPNKAALFYFIAALIVDRTEKRRCAFCQRLLHGTYRKCQWKTPPTAITILDNKVVRRKKPWDWLPSGG